MIAANDPTWCWYVGCLGQVKWFVAQYDIPGRLKDNPPWHHAWDEISSENAMVKVVLLQGSWEMIPRCLLDSEMLEAVIQVSDNPGRKK